MQICAGTEHELHSKRLGYRLLEACNAEEVSQAGVIASRMMAALEVAARERRHPLQHDRPEKLPCLAMLGKRDLLDLGAEPLQLAGGLAHGGVHVFLGARLGESFAQNAE